MDEGLPKLWIIRQTLHLRQRHPELFGPEAQYRPLYAWGAKDDHVVAFLRGERVIAVAPRFVMRLGADWMDTMLELPSGQWHNILTGDEVAGGAVLLRNLLARFPVGLWVWRDK
jgi:(1->4)-alpha-D-glucan 1-alpha-D-glucosylmutase